MMMVRIARMQASGGLGGTKQIKLREDRVAFVQQVYDTLAHVPGVTTVAVASSLPFDGTHPAAMWATPDAADDRTKYREATFRAVLPAPGHPRMPRRSDGSRNRGNKADAASVLKGTVSSSGAFPRSYPYA